MQDPPVQVSVVVQKAPSSQFDPLVSKAVQASALSSQVSLQSPSPSGPGHGSPGLPQEPVVHTSTPLQKTPSSVHGVPLLSVVQVPSVPLRLHASHSLPQAVSQQTPSMQLPLRHSLPAPQTCPSIFLQAPEPSQSSWPAVQSEFGSVLVVTGPQVPSVPPVSAAAHDWQVPEHDVSQQKPLSQVTLPLQSSVPTHVAGQAALVPSHR